QIKTIEVKYPELVTPNSPTQRVGAPVKSDLPSIAHRIPMLSLANAFSHEDMHDFVKRVASELGKNPEDLMFVAEPKIDGLALSLTYENGSLTSAVTRGDGQEGESVLHTVKTVKN